MARLWLPKLARGPRYKYLRKGKTGKNIDYCVPNINIFLTRIVRITTSYPSQNFYLNKNTDFRLFY